MMIDIYAKKECGICASAKEKLRLMGLPHKTFDLDKVMEHHEGWREDGSVEVLAAYAMLDSHVPVICIDGEYHDYPGAMRFLKGLVMPPRAGQARGPRKKTGDRVVSEPPLACGERV